MKRDDVWKGVGRDLERLTSEAAEAGMVSEPAMPYGSFGSGDSWESLRSAVSEGAPWSILESVKSGMGWSDASLARFLRVSEKTLQRSRVAGKELGPDAAEKILELTSVLMLGLEIFGERGRFFGWLRAPGIWFNEESPENLLFDSIGRQVVREALQRIDHGIWS